MQKRAILVSGNFFIGFYITKIIRLVSVLSGSQGTKKENNKSTKWKSKLKLKVDGT